MSEQDKNADGKIDPTGTRGKHAKHNVEEPAAPATRDGGELEAPDITPDEDEASGNGDPAPRHVPAGSAHAVPGRGEPHSAGAAGWRAADKILDASARGLARLKEAMEPAARELSTRLRRGMGEPRDFGSLDRCITAVLDDGASQLQNLARRRVVHQIRARFDAFDEDGFSAEAFDGAWRDLGCEIVTARPLNVAVNGGRTHIGNGARGEMLGKSAPKPFAAQEPAPEGHGAGPGGAMDMPARPVMLSHGRGLGRFAQRFSGKLDDWQHENYELVLCQAIGAYLMDGARAEVPGWVIAALFDFAAYLDSETLISRRVTRGGFEEKKELADSFARAWLWIGDMFFEL